jgi:glyoxylase-like metal-dependent hydrolase (beta-lactamase superfamily II)
MILDKIVVGEMEVNCYILADEETRETIIIDPGDDYAKIKRRLDNLDLKPKLILDTHGHIDHIGANDKFNLPIWIHKQDSDYLTHPQRNLSTFFVSPYVSPTADRLLEEGDKIRVGKEIVLEVIHTPGHTPGGICLKGDGFVFTGDTLFSGGIGRTDFPESSEKELLKSIREKILTLDEDMVIYPGHGPTSTIKAEKRDNPFICVS